MFSFCFQCISSEFKKRSCDDYLSQGIFSMMHYIRIIYSSLFVVGLDTQHLTKSLSRIYQALRQPRIVEFVKVNVSFHITSKELNFSVKEQLKFMSISMSSSSSLSLSGRIIEVHKYPLTHTALCQCSQLVYIFLLSKQIIRR